MQSFLEKKIIFENEQKLHYLQHTCIYILYTCIYILYKSASSGVIPVQLILLFAMVYGRVEFCPHDYLPYM